MENLKIYDLRKLIKERDLIQKYNDKFGKGYTKAKKSELIEILKENEKDYQNFNYEEYVNTNKEKVELKKKNVKYNVDLLLANAEDESLNIVEQQYRNELNLQNGEHQNDLTNVVEVEVINDNQSTDIRPVEVSEDIKTNNRGNKVTFSNEEDTKAMMKVNKYFDRFPWLKKCEYSSTARFDPKELLKEVEIQLSNHNNSNLIADNFILGISGVETLVTQILPQKSKFFREGFIPDEQLKPNQQPKPLMKLNGLTNVVAANQAIRDTLDELTIKYMDDISLDFITPERRLGLLLLGCCYTTHLINTENEMKKEELKNDVRQKIPKKFDNL